MKKIIFLLLTFSFVFILSSCSEKKNTVDEGILEHYSHDSLYFEYKTDNYSFRLPEFWKGKFMVVTTKGIEQFYEINSYNENESGLIFSIYEYENKDYKKEHKNYTHLGYDEEKKLHYVLVLPDEVTYVAENEELYNDLSKAISIVNVTFKF